MYANSKKEKPGCQEIQDEIQAVANESNCITYVRWNFTEVLGRNKELT